ncbi:MAG: hypothetical protein Q7J16_02225 [Candidatus Cloacimonadales bacterium]|nr:hypothetical protein [Candidatus Cloacimonadales bacterium]
MKKIKLIFLAIAITTILSAKGIDFFANAELETIYTNNVLQLSNHDLDRFETGNETNKFHLETSDDLIFSQKLEIGMKHYLFAGHTQIDKIMFKFNKHLQNDLLDDGYLGIDIKQFLSRKLNFQISYYYYPEIYVNRYKSVLENNGSYRDFTYSKNDYNASLNWKAHNLVELTYRFSFSQLYYNRYFTEYDAVNFDNKITAEISPQGNIRTILSYEYKLSNADGEEAFDDPASVSVVKDASYEANHYSLAFIVPKLYEVGKNYLYFQVGMDYEQRYFRNDAEVDEYHFDREDYTFSADSSVSCKVAKKVGLKLSGKYEERNTRSPFSDVKRDKSYDLIEAGLRVSYEF